MAEQDILALWPRIRTELAVYLGRPSVQLQLLVVAIALALAAVAGRAAQRRWIGRFGDGIAEAGVGRRLIHHLFLQLSSAALALAFIQPARAILALVGARTALIDSLVGIVVLYLTLKAALAVAFAFGDGAGIRWYQRTLITPLFAAIIGVRLLGLFFPGDRLADAPVFTLFDNTVTLAALFLVTGGFYLWIVGVQAIGQSVHYLATRYGGADEGSTQATLTLLRYLLIIIGVVYVLFRLNFNTTTIAAISGGLSVGIGFALSTILSNFVSGILLLFERTLHPGDIIEYNGILCTVEMITIRSIRVRTFDNVEMIIPNSDFMTAPFTTYTGQSRQVRLRLPVGASYHDNHRQVMDTLLDVAAACPHVLTTPPPEVILENFGDFSLDYQLYVWIANPMLTLRVKNELNQATLDAFEAKGITIPFPTMIKIDAPKE